MTRTYRVEGMSCGGCAGSVQRAVEGAVADAQVAVSFERQTVTVDGRHEAQAVKDAVQNAGYVFDGEVVG